jgi:DNA-binding transcriptional MerR regulator
MSKLNRIIRFIAENGETEYAHRLKFIKEISESIALEDETPEERKKREESEREREKESAERLKELEAEKKTGEEITKPSSEVSGPSRFWGGGGFLDVQKGLRGVGIPTSGRDVAKLGQQAGAGVLGAVTGGLKGIGRDLTTRLAASIGTNIPGGGAATFGAIEGAQQAARNTGSLIDFERKHTQEIEKLKNIIDDPNTEGKEKERAHRRLATLEASRGRIVKRRVGGYGDLGTRSVTDPSMRNILRQLTSLGGRPIR